MKSCFCCVNPYWINEEYYQNASKEYETIQFVPSQNDHKLRLLYLTTFKTRDNISPFTAEEARVIKISEQADRTATCWLIGGGSLSIIAGTLSGIATQYFSAIPAFFSACTGCFATGTYPHVSSNAANMRQNIYNHQITSTYKKMGQELIKMKNDDPKLATHIATELDLEKIRRIIRLHFEIVEADKLLYPLEDAREYVLFGNIPSRVTSLTHLVQLDLLHKRCAFLEKLLEL